ncbi:uncharacterized protein LOC127137670 [Lathyrus oleraceus]|uniref:uncharacterized protein LOC127137670 n=1 Tax=Pisum sativum TaxID=3888 RepID=UPI0021D1B966|nr:uncharacterized protein LOC127137670 [Pisum sativum]
MKEHLTEKRKLKCDENIVLAAMCGAIIQHKLPLKLTDSCRFTIHYSIGPLKIGHALCDLGANTKLMSLSMMRRLSYGEPKSIHMTFTLAYRFITYPYEVLKDVFMRVDDSLFLVDFVILDMTEDYETPLLFKRLFLTTGRVLIDVEMGEIILRFNKEQVIFNVFKP